MTRKREGPRRPKSELDYNKTRAEKSWRSVLKHTDPTTHLYNPNYTRPGWEDIPEMEQAEQEGSTE